MIVLCANSRGLEFGYLQGRFGGLGHLYSPNGGATSSVWDWLPYALDNGRFPCFKNGTEWDVEGYRSFIEWASRQWPAPSWVLVPDVVGDAAATLEEWENWRGFYPRGWKLAFAAQDGMEPADVPGDADVVFVGGSVEWKWRTVRKWTENFPRVHVGRVCSPDRLWQCLDLGVESVDGTGWFRGDRNQTSGLIRFLMNQDRRDFVQLALWDIEQQENRR